jgi:purine nucleosidase
LLQAVIATSGNVWSDDAAANISRLLHSLGKDEVPVFSGLPMQYHAERIRYYLRDERQASPPISYAGAFDDRRVDNFDTSTVEPHAADIATTNPGVQYLMRTVIEERQPVTVALIGPATALWVALERQPALRGLIRHVYIMGGAVSIPGNASKRAEFNFWFDPVAANGVLTSGLPITLVPLDAMQGITYPDDLTADIQGDSPALRYVQDYLRQRRVRSKGPFLMWDEVVAAMLINDAIISSETLTCARVVTTHGRHFGELRTEKEGDNEHCQPVRLILGVRAPLIVTVLRTVLSCADVPNGAESR